MTSTIDALNRLAVVNSRSLASYLSYAVPYFSPKNGEAGAMLRRISQDQQAVADRVSAMILDSNGVVEPGEFPMKYTALHDLAFDYLLEQLVAYQRHLVATTEECAGQLSLAPMARSLAEEALGEAKGHLEILEDLAASAAQS